VGEAGAAYQTLGRLILTVIVPTQQIVPLLVLAALAGGICPVTRAFGDLHYLA